jgi:hypothetical protein
MRDKFDCAPADAVGRSKKRKIKKRKPGLEGGEPGAPTDRLTLRTARQRIFPVNINQSVSNLKHKIS